MYLNYYKSRNKLDVKNTHFSKYEKNKKSNTKNKSKSSAYKKKNQKIKKKYERFYRKIASKNYDCVRIKKLEKNSV